MPTKPHSQATKGIGADAIRRDDECLAMACCVARLHDCQPRRGHRAPDQRGASSSGCPRELQATVAAADQVIRIRCATRAQTLQLRMARQRDSAQHERQRRTMQRDDGAAERQHVHKRYGRAKRGRSLQEKMHVAGQSRLKISVPLVPPKPNEFDNAARIGISRAVRGA